MIVTFAGIEFDEVVEDRDADILYLNVCDAEPVLWEETPEGHLVRFDVCKELCGVTIIGLSHHVDEKGLVNITVPKEEQIDLDGVVEFA